VEHAMESLYAHYFQHHGKIDSSIDEGATLKGVSSSSTMGLSSVMVDDEDYSRFVKSQFKRHLMKKKVLKVSQKL
jgi:hypothetical protein